MRYTVNSNCIKTRICENYLGSIASCRVSIKGCIYICIKMLSNLWNLGEKVEADVLRNFLAISSIDVAESLVVYEHNLKLFAKIVHYVLDKNCNPILGCVSAINLISIKAWVDYHHELLQYIYNNVLIWLSKERHLVNGSVIIVISQNLAYYAVNLICWLIVLAIHNSCLSIYSKLIFTC